MPWRLMAIKFRNRRQIKQAAPLIKAAPELALRLERLTRVLADCFDGITDDSARWELIESERLIDRLNNEMR
jgi:hypothetical protein